MTGQWEFDQIIRLTMGGLAFATHLFTEWGGGDSKIGDICLAYQPWYFSASFSPEVFEPFPSSIAHSYSEFCNEPETARKLFVTVKITAVLDQ